MKTRKYWFKAKRYGWGWYPSSWEGWLVTLIAIAFIVFIARDVDSRSHSVSDTVIGTVVPMAGVVLILLAICLKTGEKPRWRWGGK